MIVTAIIPARGGSKGIPGKNVVDFHGRPLIAWTIIAALESSCFDHIVVSTDCPEIARAARDYGAETPYRPTQISGDEAPTMPVVLHALKQYPSDTIVLLQPTSPLRIAADIRACIELHRKTCRPVVSFAPAKPWLFTLGDDGSAQPVLPVASARQKVATVAPNGAVYVAASATIEAGGSWFDDAVAYVMPCERSIDIDTPMDLMVARQAFAEAA